MIELLEAGPPEEASRFQNYVTWRRRAVVLGAVGVVAAVSFGYYGGYTNGRSKTVAECRARGVGKVSAFALTRHEVRLARPQAIMRSQPGLSQALSGDGPIVIQGEPLNLSPLNATYDANLQSQVAGQTNLFVFYARNYRRDVYSSGVLVPDRIPAVPQVVDHQPAVMELIVRNYSCPPN